jgi:lipopolysaccharide biosynthesis regulator YciM
VGSVVLLIILVLAVAAVVLLPIWRTRRRKSVSLLARYQTITEAVLAGDLARAREELKEIIRGDTEDVGAYLRLTQILQREGDYERAVAVRRSLLARDIRDRDAKLAIYRGLLEDLMHLKRFDEAVHVAEELRHLDRRSALAARAQIEVALEQDEGETALHALDRLRRSDEDAYREEAPRVRVAVAWIRLQQGERKEACKLLEEALKLDEGFMPAVLLLGDLWGEDGEHERAVELWTQFVRQHPAAAGHLVSRLERAFFELGRFGDLERFYESVIVSDGGPAAALRLALARMALRKGHAGQALALVEELLQLEPEHAIAREWRLYLLGEAGRGAEARQILKQAVDASMMSSEETKCPHCGKANQLIALRCIACGAWLPDPASGRPAGPPSGLA